MPSWPWSAGRGTARASGRSRRTARAGERRPLGSSLRSWVMPAAGAGLIVFGLAAAVIGLSRGRLLPGEGRVLDQTYTVREAFRVPDKAATERARTARRLMAPRVYVVDERVVRELETSLLSLPAALSAAERLDDVAGEIRTAYGLTDEQLGVLRALGQDDAARSAWGERVRKFVQLLAQRPILENEEFQLALNDTAPVLELRGTPGEATRIAKALALNAGADIREALVPLVQEAGFTGTLAQVVLRRVTLRPEATHRFDRAESELVQAEAASAAPEEMVTFRAGEVLARRGEVLSPEQADLMARENESFRASLAVETRVRVGVGVGLAAALVTGVLGLFIWLFRPRVVEEPASLMGLAGVVGLGAALACAGAIAAPSWVWPALTAPLMLTAMILVIAFDAKVMLAGVLASVMIVLASVSAPAGFTAVALAGSASAAWRLREVRGRNDVVRAALTGALTVGAGTLAVSLLGRPLAPGAGTLPLEMLGDALSSGAGAFAAGALLLVALPSIERLFNVTTGMTLSEWRDAKQPLIRKLQQLAPGTFNHSHTVAALAEAAAEAIGADGFHVYVGALYHDVGKMNKPDYFVENQAGGFNRHAKLSPAMSLLVIVGHVKDGVELAREHNLPRSLAEYIESHHGTTLVEYFFDQARRQAEEGEDEEIPSEVEYRYPGPKPRTREQAILMICDAVESATRAMPEPTPARISALVHGIATKRLMDGQFDECGLTLRELRQIEESVTKTLQAIYHGRLAYPGSDSRDEREGRQPPRTRAGGATG